MILFPNCKINLGLKILRRREDGYHELETIFYPLAVKDVLEAVPANQLTFTASGIPIPGAEASNLCLKAYQLLKMDYPALPPVHIFLHKNIPIGAGLGGGSSDGAFMLQLLDRNFGLNIPIEQLLEYAARLGSDCPFFILNKPCLGTGRGELLQPLQMDLSGYSILLVTPGIHIGTAWAFSQIKPNPERPALADIIKTPVEIWSKQLINDFEEPVFRQYPELQEIKDRLYQQGAHYASMTGSGSSLFGIFKKGTIPETIHQHFPCTYQDLHLSATP